MTENKNSGADQASEDVTVETTSVFRADFLNELDAPPAAGAEGAVSGVEGLPAGSALLVVKRGLAIRIFQAVLEIPNAAGDVAHDAGNLSFAAEHEGYDNKKDQPMPNAKATHRLCLR